MPRLRFVLALLAGLTVALPLAAQKKDKKEEKQEEKKEEKKAPEEDVVIDNRGLAKKKAMEEEQQEDQMYESDSPFASGKPNPTAQRERTWKPGVGGHVALGFAFPMGDYDKTAKLSESVNGLIFLGGDIGYWFIPHLFAGLGVSGGYVLAECSDQASCSGWLVRGGPTVQARLSPYANFTPFLGVGAGYEWMQLSASTDAFSVSQSAHGFELLNLQAGFEVRSHGQFYGMFVGYSMAKFTKQSVSVESDTQGDSERSGDIDDPRTHGWLTIGARGTVD